jgi:hypothetical protein
MAEIAVPTSAFGIVVLVTISFAAMVMLKEPETVPPLESVAVTDTWNVPAVVGVPLKVPVVESVNPGGRPVAVKVYGPLPPVTDTAEVYAIPTAPLENVTLEKVRLAAAIVRV